MWRALHLTSVLEPALAMACDMHPAWDTHNRWVAINGRPERGNRQVMVAYIGNDPDFEPDPSGRADHTSFAWKKATQEP